MAKNHMPEVAKMLGVEIGEWFRINEIGHYHPTLYRLENSGAWDENDNVADDIIPALITGSYEIIKLSWKPKFKEGYYYPCTYEQKIFYTLWVNSTFDYAMHNLGMCYKTIKEARENFSKDYKKLTGKGLEE